ncbi:MAG: hypothetical protein VX498_12355 [Myxococcota bacterium]|nr:hypothetical protein [Myxococcota bacterium]
MQQAVVKREALLLGLVFGLTFLFALLRFEGATEGYWDTYITAPAVFMTGQDVDFVLEDGSPAWEFDLRGELPADLVDKDSFGIITKDQRIGAPVVAAPLFAAFGLFGMRLLFALSVALIIPCGVLACRSALRQAGRLPSPLVTLTAAAVMAWNPYVLSVVRLNANLLALPLALLLIHLLLREETPLLATGLLFGVLAGIRNEAICFLPAICLWMLLDGGQVRRSLGERFARLCKLGLCTALAMAPVFYWKWYAFGHPLMHPSQYPHFQGFRPEFLHQFLGWEFRFNGLFNWPLHDEMVRTPHFGYPTYLLFPLVTLRSLGAVFCAVILWGLARLLRSHRLVAGFCVAWMLPVYLLFGPQENWEEVKMTFMLLAWPPLVPLFACGLEGLTAPSTRRPQLVLLLGATLLLMAAGWGLGSLEFPEDERWYLRFPKADRDAQPPAQAGLAQDDRNDWVYFQSYETAAEIARERSKLRSVRPWPDRYLPVRLDPSASWTDMRQELGQRNLEVLEIWGYIYGSRR